MSVTLDERRVIGQVTDVVAVVHPPRLGDARRSGTRDVRAANSSLKGGASAAIGPAGPPRSVREDENSHSQSP